MSIKFKEKMMEGVIIGLTTSIMIIFITFLWTQALKVSDVMDNVESKMVEVIKTFNESNKVLEDRIVQLESNKNMEEPKMLIEAIPLEIDDIPQQQIILPQIQQYEKRWK